MSAAIIRPPSARRLLTLAVKALEAQHKALAFDGNVFEAFGIEGDGGEYKRAAALRGELVAAIAYVRKLRDTDPDR